MSYYTLEELARNPQLLDELRERANQSQEEQDAESDYFDTFGDFIEQNPIGGGGIRRS
jgi:hypothetical protein